jgi:hypothetical protein
MGAAYDNTLALEGKIQFPRGIFSREAKDLISRLCAVERRSRLGEGPHGWREVAAHPFFADVDWALLEAKVLPAPLLPHYTMPLGLAAPPEKLEGERRRAGVAEAAVPTPVPAPAATLTAEDEAIFAVASFTDADMLTRSLMKWVAANGDIAQLPVAPMPKAAPGGVCLQ